MTPLDSAHSDVGTESKGAPAMAVSPAQHDVAALPICVGPVCLDFLGSAIVFVVIVAVAALAVWL